MAALIHRDTTSGVNTGPGVTTSGSINLSSKIVAGDLLVAKVYFASATGVVTAPSAPTGWSSPPGNTSLQRVSFQPAGTPDFGVAVFTKTAVTADAGAAFTVDF